MISRRSESNILIGVGPEPNHQSQLTQEDPEACISFDATADLELFHSRPRVTAKNVTWARWGVSGIMRAWQRGPPGIPGVELGNACCDFIHREESEQ